MTQFPTYVCEICGAPKRKQGNWYLVAQDRWGDSLRILFWNDAVASQPLAWAFCCPAHVQHFVRRWLAADSAADFGEFPLPAERPVFGLTAQQEEKLRDALIGELQVSRSALSSSFALEGESALSILDAIEAVLQSCAPDTESESDEAPVFDA
jgi:hypothetical protein